MCLTTFAGGLTSGAIAGHRNVVIFSASTMSTSTMSLCIMMK